MPSFSCGASYAIYVHIPYCRRRCTYCDFHFSTQLSHKPDFVRALTQEIELRQDAFREGTLASLYFGGGTPSLLAPEEWERIFETLARYVGWGTSAPEITLEANPEDITSEKVQRWRTLGINRLSLGLQSMNDATLQWMNRPHHHNQNLACIEIAQASGIDNISVDYILGVPGLSSQKLAQEIGSILDTNIPHLSAYILNVEEKTALAYQVKKGISPPVDDAESAKQFIQLHHLLVAHGFEHYEISNYAKAKFQSTHNSSYWKGQTCIGLGPSAVSFASPMRRKNNAHTLNYIREILQNKHIPHDIELLSPKEIYNEYLMLGLRTQHGISVEQLLRLRPQTKEHLECHLLPFEQKGWLVHTEGTFTSTLEGWLFSDQMAASLFW